MTTAEISRPEQIFVLKLLLGGRTPAWIADVANLRAHDVRALIASAGGDDRQKIQATLLGLLRAHREISAQPIAVGAGAMSAVPAPRAPKARAATVTPLRPAVPVPAAPVPAPAETVAATAPADPILAAAAIPVTVPAYARPEDVTIGLWRWAHEHHEREHDDFTAWCGTCTPGDPLDVRTQVAWPCAGVLAGLGLADEHAYQQAQTLLTADALEQAARITVEERYGASLRPVLDKAMPKDRTLIYAHADDQVLDAIEDGQLRVAHVANLIRDVLPGHRVQTCNECQAVPVPKRAKR